MSMKSTIKSKKEKMLQKKSSKNKTVNVIDLIDSSQEDEGPQPIQKRNKYSGKSINNNSNQQTKPMPNYLNLDRLRKATIQNRNIAQKVVENYNEQKKDRNNDDTNLLIVEQTLQDNPYSNNQRSLFSYKLLGKSEIKYISQSHHKSKVGEEMKEIQRQQVKRWQKQQDELYKIIDGNYPSSSEDQLKKKQEKTQQKKQQVVERKRVPRYYEEDLSDEQDEEKFQKCFRCNKRGHIAKNCIQQEPKIVCSYCLQNHHCSRCDSSPCFKCCKPGHISQHCESQQISCKKCGKRGHKQDKCGVFLSLDYHNKTQEDIKKRFKISDLKKLKCLAHCKAPDGHFNCFTYNNSKHLHPYAVQKKSRYFQNQSNYRRR